MFLCTSLPIVGFDEIVYCCPLLTLIYEDDNKVVDTEILEYTCQNGSDWLISAYTWMP